MLVNDNDEQTKRHHHRCYIEEPFIDADVGTLQVEVDSRHRPDFFHVLSRNDLVFLRHRPFNRQNIVDYENFENVECLLTQDPRLWPISPPYEQRLKVDMHPQDTLQSLPYHRALAMRGLYIPGYVMLLFSMIAPDVWTRLIVTFREKSSTSQKSIKAAAFSSKIKKKIDATRSQQPQSLLGQLPFSRIQSEPTPRSVAVERFSPRSRTITFENKEITLPTNRNERKNIDNSQLKRSTTKQLIEEPRLLELLRDYDFGQYRLRYLCEWKGISRSEVHFGIDIRTALHDFIIFYLMAPTIKITPEQALLLAVERTKKLLSLLGLKTEIPHPTATEQLLYGYRRVWRYHPALNVELIRDLVQPSTQSPHQQQLILSTQQPHFHPSEKRNRTVDSSSLLQENLWKDSLQAIFNENEPSQSESSETSSSESSDPSFRDRGLSIKQNSSVATKPRRIVSFESTVRPEAKKNVLKEVSSEVIEAEAVRLESINESKHLSSDAQSSLAANQIVFTPPKNGQLQKMESILVSSSSSQTLSLTSSQSLQSSSVMSSTSFIRDQSQNQQKEQWSSKKKQGPEIHGDGRRMFQFVFYAEMANYFAFHGMRLNRLIHEDVIDHFFQGSIKRLAIHQIPNLINEIRLYIKLEYLLLRQPLIIPKLYTNVLTIPYPYWAMANVDRYEILRPKNFPQLALATVAMARVRRLGPLIDLESEMLKKPTKGILQLAYLSLLEILERTAEQHGYRRHKGQLWGTKRIKSANVRTELVPKNLQHVVQDPLLELARHRLRQDLSSFETPQELMKKKEAVGSFVTQTKNK